MPALFELDQIPKLPLFAQAFVASRMARRAIFHLPKEFSAADRKAMLGVCDALDEIAMSGNCSEKELSAQGAVIDRVRGGDAGEAAEALYWAWDCAGAAQAASDFPVDATCIRDAENAMAAASRAHGLSPLQVRLFAAADLDQLRFACAEAHVGFYDALGPSVMGRMAPVYPPDDR